MKRIVLVVIIVGVILVGWLIWKAIHQSKTNKGISASTEQVFPINQFLKKNGSLHQCSYSIWFQVDEWTNDKKILFKRVGSNGKTEFLVFFDDYVNNLNIFLPEMENTFHRSNNCEITKGKIKELDTTNELCERACSSHEACNSYSYSKNLDVTIGNISWDAKFGKEVTFEGNLSYDNFMNPPKPHGSGKCILFSSSPSMPNNCLLNQDKEEIDPYSVYNWSEFIYSNKYNSYTLNKCSFPIPLQKWTNLIITINDFVMEIYVNGKIIKSVTLTEKIISNPSNFIVTPEGFGFKGYTRNFKYWNKCLTSQEINKITKKVFV